jgi:hypothetical protein
MVGLRLSAGEADAMTVVAWPEWLPDQADFGNQGSPLIKNCVPLTPKSYGPMPTAVPLSTNTLNERCQGAYSLKAPDEGIHTFAGDRQKLYRLPPGSLTLADVSRTAGGAYATPDGGHWSMTSYGSRVIATNGVDPIQTLLLPTDTHFSLLSPDAPIAKYCATVRDFLMVGNTTDPVSGAVPYRVWWSSINDPTSWPTPGGTTAISVQSDYNEMQQTDLGNVTGLVSGFSQGADAVIFMERGLWIANYAGPPLIFSFRVQSGASGCIAPLSIVQSFARTQAGATVPVVYYLSEDGFAAFDGSTAFPIGAQKFDREFHKLVDDAYINRVQGVSDPRTRSILWAFPAIGGGGLLNRMLVYNWELSRAALVELEPEQVVEWLSKAMYGTSYTLDSIDSFGDLDTIFPSFDDPFWVGNQTSRLTLFDTDHRLNIGGGPAMAPTLETAELQPVPGRRAWVDLVRPLIDGGVATVAVGHRERLTDPVTWEPPVPINVIGECPQRYTGRYIRLRMAMPAAQGFSHLQGLDLGQLRPEGSLR